MNEFKEWLEDAFVLAYEVCREQGWIDNLFMFVSGVLLIVTVAVLAASL